MAFDVPKESVAALLAFQSDDIQQAPAVAIKVAHQERLVTGRPEIARTTGFALAIGVMDKDDGGAKLEEHSTAVEYSAHVHGGVLVLVSLEEADQRIHNHHGRLDRKSTRLNSSHL